MGVIVPNFASSTEDRASGAQVIDGGLRFDSGKSHYLSRTPASAGNRKTWTWAGWVKRSGSYKFLFDVYTGVNNDSGWNGILFSTNNTIRFQGWFTIYAETNAVYRDTSAWYHVVVALDSTQATSSDRIKIYINGTEQSLAISNVTLNQDYIINTNSPHTLGSDRGVSSYFDGSLTNTYLIDGQALGPEYFGYTDPLTNTWRPKKFKPQATPNNGTTWSNYLTSSTGSFYPGNGPTNLFDGNLSTNCDASTSSGSVTFTPPSIIRFSGDLRVYQSVSGVDFELTDENDVTTTISKSSAASWATVKSGGGTLKSLKCTPTSNNYCNWRAIEIDGVTLLDTDTTNMGVNAFYLPFDGSAPIGQDQSGRGNDWTPVNFGGSNTIEKATGALPILNTDGGGKVARPGTRTDANASYIVLALPLVGIKSDFSNQINSGSTTKTITSVNAVASYTQSNFYGGSYAFDGSGDALTSTTSGLAPGTSDFCCEGWFYYNAQPSTSAYRLLGNVNSVANTTDWQLIQQTNGNLTIWSGSANTSIGTSPIPTASWTHIAYVRDGATHKVYINGVQMSSTVTRTGHNLTYNGLDIGGRNDGAECINGYIQDVRFYIGTTKYTSNFIPASTNPDILPDTPSGVSYSSKLTQITDGAVSFDGNDNLDAGSSSDFEFSSNHTIEAWIYPRSTSSDSIVAYYYYTDGAGEQGWYFGIQTSTQKLRLGKAGGSSVVSSSKISLNAWTHVAAVTTSGTTQLYINGVADGNSGSIGTPTYSDVRLTVGSLVYASQETGYGNYFDGFISNVRIIKGTALYTSNFTPPSAPLSNVTNTVLLCCQSNTSATTAAVTPGSITAYGDAAATNFNPFTDDIDTQRGKQSGYATLNNLKSSYTGGTVAITNGNLDFSANMSSNQITTPATIGVSSGKWYWEATCNSITTQYGTDGAVGISTDGDIDNGTASPSRARFYEDDGDFFNGSSRSAYGATWGAGDVIGVALDLDAGTLTFYKNGATQGTAISGLSGTWFPVVSSNNIVTFSLNFGQKPFRFPPPAGFQPLNAANVRPSTVIARPDQYVGVTTYTGNGGTQNIITGFKPDFVWIKGRSSSTQEHRIFDSVRGAYNYLETNSTEQENNGGTPTTGLTNFTSNGFTLLDNTDGNSNVNGAVGGLYSGNAQYVAWCWKAGGNSNTFNIDDVGYDTASAAGLTAGTITPTGASVNTKSGFSIITYTGSGSNASISHGLGKAPAMIIVKNRDAAVNWFVYHRGIASDAETYFIKLNTTDAAADLNTAWNDTAPTSTVFSIGTDGSVNQSSDDHVAYCWAEIPGLQKFGSYIGNGSTDGPVIITGFRPRWVLTKASSSAGAADDWLIFDTVRDSYNVSNKNISANYSGQEQYYSGNLLRPTDVDILSNGFKLRNTRDASNLSGATYIYAAFAEAPSINLYGAQSNAR